MTTINAAASAPAIAGKSDASSTSSAEKTKPDVPCPACTLLMPAAAHKCKECGEWKNGWRRFLAGSEIGLSLLLGLVSIISLIGPWMIGQLWPESETSAIIVTNDGDLLQVAVSNTGRRPSVLRSFFISFDHPDFPERTVMGLTSQKSVLMPDEHEVVTLNLKQFKIPASHENEIKEWIKSGQVTLHVFVKESDTKLGEKEPDRQATMEARLLESWILQHINWTK